MKKLLVLLFVAFGSLHSGSYGYGTQKAHSEVLTEYRAEISAAITRTKDLIAQKLNFKGAKRHLVRLKAAQAAAKVLYPYEANKTKATKSLKKAYADFMVSEAKYLYEGEMQKFTNVIDKPIGKINLEFRTNTIKDAEKLRENEKEFKEELASVKKTNYTKIISLATARINDLLDEPKLGDKVEVAEMYLDAVKAAIERTKEMALPFQMQKLASIQKRDVKHKSNYNKKLVNLAKKQLGKLRVKQGLAKGAGLLSNKQDSQKATYREVKSFTNFMISQVDYVFKFEKQKLDLLISKARQGATLRPKLEAKLKSLTAASTLFDVKKNTGIKKLQQTIDHANSTIVDMLRASEIEENTFKILDLN